MRQPLSAERVCADIICFAGLYICPLGIDTNAFEHMVVRLESGEAKETPLRPHLAP